MKNYIDGGEAICTKDHGGLAKDLIAKGVRALRYVWTTVNKRNVGIGTR